MSQTTFDDDELFGEAADEMRADVEEHLAAARESLPDADAVWVVESDNTLGVLNALKGALDTGDAEDHLRDAKKWYTMGKRAVEAHGQVSDLAAAIPELRSALEDAESEDSEDSEG